MTSPEGLLSILGHRPGRSFSFRRWSSIRQHFSAGALEASAAHVYVCLSREKKTVSDRLRGNNTASVEYSRYFFDIPGLQEMEKSNC